MMNPTLSFADWHKLRNLDGGMYGIFNGDPNEPENPAETYAVPRIVTLNPGQPLFRWVHSLAGRSHADKAAGPWWSSKRGAQKVLERARKAGSKDTSEHARWYSSVARSWGSDLGEVVHAMVTQPIRAFMGIGRNIHDPVHGERWDSHGLQLYIPGMSEKRHGVTTLSTIARHHLRVVWVKASDDFDRWALERAMAKGRRMAE